MGFNYMDGFSLLLSDLVAILLKIWLCQRVGYSSITIIFTFFK